MGSFDGYSIATSALRAFRHGLNIAGYNVANASTDGFSRRRIDLEVMSAVAVPGGWAGMGVEVSSTRRVRDPFLDFAVRREAGRLGADNARTDILSALEPAIGEVETAPLRSSISDFFDSLNNLSNQPGDMAIREDVARKAQNIAEAINSFDGYIVENRTQADGKAIEAVDRINDLIETLATMNLEVTALEAGGEEASDLRDQRDLVLDELASLVPVNVVTATNGQISVALSNTGDKLVSGTGHFILEKTVDSDGMTRVAVTRAGVLTDITDSLRSGTLGGYLAVRDEDLTGYRQQLDNLASSLITELNAIHRGGFDLNGDAGLNFFEPDPPGANAANAIRFNSLIRDDPSLIAAASAPGEPGNNANANLMLELRDEGIAALGGRSLAGYAADTIATVGQDRATFEAAFEASLVIVDSLEEKRQGVSAVSLDEEAASLAQWQQSFEAAAKFLQTMNRVTEVALNMF